MSCQNLKVRSKTFFWASFFFSKKERLDINILYSFCRFIDDISDSNNYDYKQAKYKLNLISRDLKRLYSEDKVISSFIEFMKKYKIDSRIPIELINGVCSDLKVVNIKNLDDLIFYSYQVAGIVGLMMCKIMQVSNPTQKKYAIELGIAMQFTNISRDLKEDLERKRIYLPKTMRSFTLKIINKSSINRNKINLYCEDNLKLIDLSNKLYLSSYRGIKNLPFRYKLPIFIASKLYQKIGFKIINNPKNVWSKRIYVNTFEKIVITIKSIFLCFVTMKVTEEEISQSIKRVLNENGKSENSKI